MASGSPIVYNHFKAELFKGNIDMDADTFKCLLLDVNHSQNPDDDFVSDINGNEVSDASYGRVTLSNVAVTVDDTDDEAEVDADDPVFSSLDNVTVDYAVIYKEVTDDTDSILVGSYPIPQTTANGSDLSIVLDAEGFLNG